MIERGNCEKYRLEICSKNKKDENTAFFNMFATSVTCDDPIFLPEHSVTYTYVSVCKIAYFTYLEYYEYKSYKNDN